MKIWLNGIDGVTGEYLQPPLELEEATALVDARNEAPVLSYVKRQGDEREKKAAKKFVLGLPPGVEPLDLAKAGWAIVAHAHEAAMLRDALLPLFTHRRKLLGNRVHFLTYAGQSRTKWLASLGVTGSNIRPDKVPYYLLFAGSSAKIPFRLVHELALDYAVGRLELDSRDDYRRYAEQLVAYETAAAPAKVAKQVAFFGPRHDQATQLSADHLLTPLATPDAEDEYAALNQTGFGHTLDIDTAATKDRLASILSLPDGERPAVLFTASHGVGLPATDPRLNASNGALVCHDWTPGTNPDGRYFTAADVPDSANVGGLMAFLFACYGAGTPATDRFFKRTTAPAKILAPAPFISALPKELLRRGALAVVGHVDRAWGYSFVAPEVGADRQHFHNFLTRILLGQPVGHAMRDFADRYANAAVDLSAAIENDEPAEKIVELWTQRNDSEAYMVIGDPAARIRLETVSG